MAVSTSQVWDVQITGWKEIEKKLALMPKQLEKAILRQAVKKATDFVRDATRAEAPVDTGLLRKSIASRAMKRNKKGTFAMFVGFKKSMYFWLRAASGMTTRALAPGKRVRYFYPAAVEFGNQHQRANPFFRRAYDRTKRLAAAMMEREIWRGIQQVVQAKVI
jgi:HK97 gp10 family phage protein